MSDGFEWVDRVERTRWWIGPPVDEYGDGYIWRSPVELRAPGLVATGTTSVAGQFGSSLSDHLMALADAWHGWNGARTWQSLDSPGMRVSATHDRRSRILLAVTVCEPRPAYGDVDGWSATVEFACEAGEQFSELARSGRHALG